MLLMQWDYLPLRWNTIKFTWPAPLPLVPKNFQAWIPVWSSEQEESNKTKGLSLSISCGGLKGGFLLQEKNACIHF